MNVWNWKGKKERNINTPNWNILKFKSVIANVIKVKEVKWNFLNKYLRVIILKSIIILKAKLILRNKKKIKVMTHACARGSVTWVMSGRMNVAWTASC
jgi:hypothetical protein